MWQVAQITSSRCSSKELCEGQRDKEALHQARQVLGRVVRSGCFALAMAFLLWSCATSYEQAGYFGEGYQDFRIDSNTFSVSFTGNSDTPKQTVEVYLLYRCAELTRDAGYDYFVIADQSTESTSSTGPGQYVGNTYSNRTRSGNWTTGQAMTSGTYFPGVVGTAYGATALIKVYKGEKPEGNPLAYDAQEVLQHLGPGVTG